MILGRSRGVLVLAIMSLWAASASKDTFASTYTLTEHGGNDVDADGVTGVFRASLGEPESTRGSCKHCHGAHNNASASRLLFESNVNDVCLTCHPRSSSEGAYRLSTWQVNYSSSVHATEPGMVWPGPTPSAKDATDAGLCTNCHNPHGQSNGAGGVYPDMLVAPVGTAFVEANKLCLTCHDASGRLSDKGFSYKRSTGQPGAYSGYDSSPHRAAGISSPYAQWPGNSLYPARPAEEKGLCLNCHDPHNGAGGAAIGMTTRSSKMLVEPMVSSYSASAKNGLCFACHDEGRLVTANSDPQKFLSKALYNQTEHALSGDAWWGTSFDGSQNSFTHWNGRSAADAGLCLNCHNPHTSTLDTLQPNGPTIPRLLVDTYNIADGIDDGPDSSDAANVQLCLDCHNPDTCGPKLPKKHHRSVTICSTCHNPHGYNTSHIRGQPPSNKMLFFNTDVVGPSESGSMDFGSGPESGPLWYYNVGGKSGCLLMCHSHDHKPSKYSVMPVPDSSGPLTQDVRADPNPTEGASAITLTATATDATTGNSTITAAEYFVDGQGADGTGIPIDAADGSFDAVLEDITATISAADWTAGSSHSLYVHAQDAAGYWGETQGVMVSVTNPVMRASTALGTPTLTASFYSDRECQLPLSTPNGFPTAGQGVVYVRVKSDQALAKPPMLVLRETDSNTPFVLGAVDGGERGWVYVWDSARSPPGRRAVFLKFVLATGEEVSPEAGAVVLRGQETQVDGLVRLSAITEPDILEADGKAESRITVRLVNLQGSPIADRVVECRRISGGGTLLGAASVTDRRGEATVIYRSGLTADTAVIRGTDLATGEYIDVAVRLRITAAAVVSLLTGAVRAASVSQPVIDVQAYPAAIPADGVSTASIVATVQDSNGQCIPGIRLDFRLGVANGLLIPIRPTTDAGGRAEALYMAGRVPGAVPVFVTDPTTGASGSVTMDLTGGGAAHMSVKVTPSKVPADGKSSALVTVKVINLEGHPVADAEIHLEAAHGLARLIPTRGFTDAFGEMSAIFLSGTSPGTETVIATVLSPAFQDSSTAAIQGNADTVMPTSRQTGWPRASGARSTSRAASSTGLFALGLRPVPSEEAPRIEEAPPEEAEEEKKAELGMSLTSGTQFWRATLDDGEHRGFRLDTYELGLDYSKPLSTSAMLRTRLVSSQTASTQAIWLSREKRTGLNVSLSTPGYVFESTFEKIRQSDFDLGLRNGIMDNRTLFSAGLLVTPRRLPHMLLSFRRQQAHTQVGEELAADTDIRYLDLATDYSSGPWEAGLLVSNRRFSHNILGQVSDSAHRLRAARVSYHTTLGSRLDLVSKLSLDSTSVSNSGNATLDIANIAWDASLGYRVGPGLPITLTYSLRDSQNKISPVNSLRAYRLCLAATLLRSGPVTLQAYVNRDTEDRIANGRRNTAAANVNITYLPSRKFRLFGNLTRQSNTQEGLEATDTDTSAAALRAVFLPSDNLELGVEYDDSSTSQIQGAAADFETLRLSLNSRWGPDLSLALAHGITRGHTYNYYVDSNTTTRNSQASLFWRVNPRLTTSASVVRTRTVGDYPLYGLSASWKLLLDLGKRTFLTYSSAQRTSNRIGLIEVPGTEFGVSQRILRFTKQISSNMDASVDLRWEGNKTGAVREARVATFNLSADF